ncbi:MAG: helicase HerA domain-containing protein [Anaerolineae bacterium]
MAMHFVEAPYNFYLGALVSPETGDVIRDDVLYYDARDLNTHGVILGMTGSGKTGLAISILEEAALDGIPMLIIDPKGDIPNMLLAFPDFTPEHFKPWVNPEEAAHNDMTVDQYAQATATRWQNGLKDWGIDNQRVQEFRRSSRFSIYTPGSSAGLPVSILQSFAAPRDGFDTNAEMYREQIAGIVTAVLALSGLNAEPVEDPEHVLLSNIFEFNWRNGRDLSMEQLILQVQTPPFSKLGVLDLDQVISERKRVQLAQRLNNIIAAPNFQSWMQGESLDIRRLLYTQDDYPRTTIFYIAHLNDAERQFIVTLLMESVIAWMRSLSGSTSLRAIVYIDEVFGMLPPHPHNPPTKEPILRLLKQARAFGIGMLLATQNPKDIDYKGLSNAGTWFIGKLQTDNDKERVLDGLSNVQDAANALDIRTVDQLINQLRPRQIIYHNVHEPDTPALMQTRWVMSYLRGPLTRDQIYTLMAIQRSSLQQQARQPRFDQVNGSIPNQPIHAQSVGQAQQPPQHGDAARPTYSVDDEPRVATGQGSLGHKRRRIPYGFVGSQPSISSSVYQYFLPVEYLPEQAIRNWSVWARREVLQVGEQPQLLYRPSLLAQAYVRLEHRQSNTSRTFTVGFVVPNMPDIPHLDWQEYESDPFDPHMLDGNPYSEAYYAELPNAFQNASGFRDLKSDLQDWIYRGYAMPVFYNPGLKMYCGLGVDRRDFMARVQAVARAQRDQEVDKVASRYDKKLEQLEERYKKAVSRLESEQEELGSRKIEELVTLGESLSQLMKGRAYYTLSRTARMRRYTTTSQDQLERKETDIQRIIEQFESTEQEMELALQEVQDKWLQIVQNNEEKEVTPYKKDINLLLFGIGWVPYWDVIINEQDVRLAASSSGLSYMQDPNVAGSYNTGYYSTGHTDQQYYDAGYDSGGYDDHGSDLDYGYGGPARGGW